jgi:hypothetical protein
MVKGKISQDDSMHNGEPRVLPQFMNEKKLSIITGVPIKTLQRWRLQGVGPKWRRFMGSVRYSTRDVEDFVSSSPSGGGNMVSAASTGKRGLY